MSQFKAKHYYRGTIKNQEFVYTGKEGEEIPSLILTIGLQGELIDTFDPTKGTIPCPAVDVSVMMRFDEYNTDAMEIVAADLQKLGFQGDDLESLNPSNSNFHTFVGQLVHVTPTIRTRNDKEVTYWNLRFPVKRENKKVAKGDIAKTGLGQAFRDILARKKQEQEEALTGSTPF